jgi:hypothetical protein
VVVFVRSIAALTPPVPTFKNKFFKSEEADHDPPRNEEEAYGTDPLVQAL